MGQRLADNTFFSQLTFSSLNAINHMLALAICCSPKNTGSHNVHFRSMFQKPCVFFDIFSLVSKKIIPESTPPPPHDADPDLEHVCWSFKVV